jgi:hypothetical protein
MLVIYIFKMVDCKNCGKTFKCMYYLTRHMSRIKPCFLKNENENNTELDKKEKIQSSEEKIQSSEEKIQSLEEKNQSLNKCMFCLTNYYCKKYKNKHELICKFKDDPIRLLEIEKDVKPCLAKSKTECRFCNVGFHNSSNLNKHFKVCKEREEYHQQLIKKETGNINNGTINNTINNYNAPVININVFGQENIEHIKTEKLIQMLRDLSLDYSRDEVYLSAGEFINLVNKYIREVPENDNFNIPDAKCLYAEVKTSEGMEKVPIDKYLEKSFKSSAKTILDKQVSIDDHNDKVFKSETNKEIFSEVKGFAKDGFRHTAKKCIGTPRQVRSAYKIGLLKKPEINF